LQVVEGTTIMLCAQCRFHNRESINPIRQAPNLEQRYCLRHLIEPHPFNSMCSKCSQLNIHRSVKVCRVIGFSLAPTLCSTRSDVPYVVSDSFVDDSR